MKIGIIGAGNIGGNFGRRWAEKGHEITFGVREPAKHKALVEACGGRAKTSDVRTAVQASDVVLLAVPWNAVAGVIKDAGSFAGKILIDATNALKWNDGPEPAVTDTSAAQKIAEMAPGARIVKAFNTLGAEHVLAPTVGGLPADAYLCSDDGGARDTVKKLAEEIGLRAIDAGPLRNARLTEHFALLWIHLATKGGLGRNSAFKLLGGA
jgi:NADPH-dependent F420 reductase